MGFFEKKQCLDGCNKEEERNEGKNDADRIIIETLSDYLTRMSTYNASYLQVNGAHHQLLRLGEMLRNALQSNINITMKKLFSAHNSKWNMKGTSTYLWPTLM